MEHSQVQQADFFVSYAHSDRAWAEWIAWTVEEDNRYRVVLQDWDFLSGSNWVQDMHTSLQNSARVIAVLSPEYLDSGFGTAEWQTAWAKDPNGSGQKLLTIRVSDCDRPGLLAMVVGIDLFGIDKLEARSRLLAMISTPPAGRAKPTTAPGFPGRDPALRQPQFPGGREADPTGTGEGSVTWLDDFRNPKTVNPRDILDAELLQNRIADFSELAELVSASYSACTPEYTWIRLELGRQVAQLDLKFQLISNWLTKTESTEDISTSSLRYYLNEYAGAANEFIRALDKLDSSLTSFGRLGLLERFGRSSRSLGHILRQINSEFSTVWPASGPSELR